MFIITIITLTFYETAIWTQKLLGGIHSKLEVSTMKTKQNWEWKFSILDFSYHLILSLSNKYSNIRSKNIMSVVVKP